MTWARYLALMLGVLCACSAAFATGKRSSYRTMEYSLFANWRTWNEARDIYPLVKTPVTLVYGANDWSTVRDRHRTRSALHLDRVVTLPDTGHFASRERPDGVVAAILVEQRADRGRSPRARP